MKPVPPLIAGVALAGFLTLAALSTTARAQPRPEAGPIDAASISAPIATVGHD